ncbi:hypothetical protein QR680_006239 [Steinernema hermaphroditum]|uniref:TIL domain-containing protein n=1 Tax=Steinernema hermaphroditum TaxID=289476 RepID=A0AA39LW76_9BILA|nr:hypothetical protein QR680_006239 [Steinernema hermaphroditum]
MLFLVCCSWILFLQVNSAPTESHLCGENEIWRKNGICDSFCVEHPYNCTQPVFASDNKCMCRQGYVRGPEAKCVLVDECPSNKTMKYELNKDTRKYLAENDPCQLTECEEKQICKNKPIPCLEGPCPLIADCVDE